MDIFADDLIALLDDLQIDKAALCGMSMGGYVVLNMLERYPERVNAACFMVTRGGADDEAGKVRRTVLADEVLRSGAGAAADIFSSILFAPQTAVAHPELIAEAEKLMLASPPTGLAGGLLAMRDRPDYSSKLKEFRLPCLVIGAADDMAIPPLESRLLAEGLTQARLCMIPQAGHMVMLEQPAAVNRTLREFLAAA
jgi:pimeloyl-ACP methyl ester carboxylesterase